MRKYISDVITKDVIASWVLHINIIKTNQEVNYGYN